MTKKLFFILSLFPHAVMADFDYKVSNTNFTISQGSEIPHAEKTYLYNYDRLRLHSDYKGDGFFATMIADGVNYAGHDYVNSPSFAYLKEMKSDTSLSTQSSFHNYYGGSVYAKLYRAYGGYEDQYNRVILGLQNIQMGVGRIWTPTNLFNPKNIYALEPDEVFGVTAVSYTRYIDETTNLTAVVSQKGDGSLKYGGRYKSFLEFADFALDAVSCDKTKMLGFEIEGNLADTGVELRSEGAYIKNEKEFYQGIVGADYGFVNGITFVAEAYYSSETFSYEDMLLNLDSEILSNMVYSNFYTGMMLSYNFNIFLDGSLLYVESFNDKNSRLISPSLTYTLNDYTQFSLGAMIQNGESYYLKWSVSF